MDSALSQQSLNLRRFLHVGIKRGRHNASKTEDTEESLAAGIATVSGKVHNALQGDQGSVLHPFAGNMLEVKISAFWAMRVARKSEGDSSTVKAIVAGVATPWFQMEDCEEEIYESASMRTKTVRAAALRTDH
jgi:hypothetical protein